MRVFCWPWTILKMIRRKLSWLYRRKIKFATLTTAAISIQLNAVRADEPLLPGLEFTTGADPWNAVHADFNNDGIVDFATANTGSRNISVNLGIGNGAFHPPTFFDLQNQPRFLAVGDFNQRRPL